MKLSHVVALAGLISIHALEANAATVAFDTSFASGAPSVVSYTSIATGATTSGAPLTFGELHIKAPFAAGSTPFTLTVNQSIPTTDTGTFHGRLSGLISIIGGFATVRFYEDELTLGGDLSTLADDVTYKLDGGGIFGGAVFGWMPTLTIPVTGSVEFDGSVVAAPVPLPPAALAAAVLLSGMGVRRYIRSRV